MLYGIGFTLLGLLIGAFSANTLVRSIPFVIQAEITAGDRVLLATKGIVNALISAYVIKRVFDISAFTDPSMYHLQ